MNSPPILEPILVVGLGNVHWGLTELDFEKPMATRLGQAAILRQGLLQQLPMAPVEAVLHRDTGIIHHNPETEPSKLPYMYRSSSNVREVRIRKPSSFQTGGLDWFGFGVQPALAEAELGMGQNETRKPLVLVLGSIYQGFMLGAHF